MKNLRIGVPIIGEKKWFASTSYIEMVLKGISSISNSDKPELFLIITKDTVEEIDQYDQFLSLFQHVIVVGKDVDIELDDTSKISIDNWDIIDSYVDLIFPANFLPLNIVNGVYWIPDSLHDELPEYFTEESVIQRKNNYSMVYNYTDAILFSSKSTKSSFLKLFDNKESIEDSLFILSPYIKHESVWTDDNPIDVQNKYNLPDRFFITSNEFLPKKNYKLLFNAISYLKKQGVSVSLVCTGSTSYSGALRHYNELKEYCKQMNIEELVYFLGYLPKSDQIQLLRRSVCVIQPSLIESWSAIVEESRVLGKKVIAADTEVLMEQAKDIGIFFDKFDNIDLAEKMKKLWGKIEPGPDIQKEKTEISNASVRLHEFEVNFKQTFDLIHKKLSENIEKPAMNDKILIIYDSKGNNTSSSRTIKSIENQTYKNYKLVYKSIDCIDFKSIKEKYFCVIEEGYELSSNFLELMISNIRDAETIVCGLIRHRKNGTNFYTTFYPINHWNINCRLYRSATIKDFHNLFKTNNFAIVYDGLVKTSLNTYIRENLRNVFDKKIYIYAAGGHTRELIDNVDFSDINLCGIIDKNTNLHGTNINGYEVFSIDKLLNGEVDYLILSSLCYEQQIYREVVKWINPDKIIKIHYDEL